MGTVKSRELSSVRGPHVNGGKDDSLLNLPVEYSIDSLTDQAQSGLDTFTRNWLNVDINQIKE